MQELFKYKQFHWREKRH